MTIRRTFLLLLAPLFLLLAGVNGALLFVWEQAEARRGLENQAIAAAVTTAAFVAGGHDLAQALADPQRAAAIRAAASKVTGLHGLYLMDPDGRSVRLAGAGGDPGRFDAPRAPVALPIADDSTGRSVATALAPAGGGRLVVAQIDAEPLAAQVAGLVRTVVALILAAGLLGVILAWSLASRIARELGRNSATIAALRADAPTADAAEGFRIRETRDLALAVRLMRTSVAGRMARGRYELARRDRERGEAGGVAAYREAAFPPLAKSAAGVRVAVRTVGEAAPGSFHALCVDGDRAALVLGECAGETPAAGLALAVAAQRFFSQRLLDGSAEARLEQARAAFGLTRLAWTQWSVAEPLAGARVLGLLDGDNVARAEAYLARAEGVAPEAALDDLAVLLRPQGVIAVLRPRSGESGEA